MVCAKKEDLATKRVAVNTPLQMDFLLFHVVPVAVVSQWISPTRRPDYQKLAAVHTYTAAGAFN